VIYLSAFQFEWIRQHFIAKICFYASTSVLSNIDNTWFPRDSMAFLFFTCVSFVQFITLFIFFHLCSWYQMSRLKSRVISYRTLQHVLSGARFLQQRRRLLIMDVKNVTISRNLCPARWIMGCVHWPSQRAMGHVHWSQRVVKFYQLTGQKTPTIWCLMLRYFWTVLSFCTFRAVFHCKLDLCRVCHHSFIYAE